MTHGKYAMAAFALAVGVIGGLLTSVAYIGLSEGVTTPAQVVVATSLMAPSVDLKVNGSGGSTNILSGSTQTVSWNTSGVSNCIAKTQYPSSSTLWSGPVAMSGSQAVETASGTQVYSLSCTTPAGGVVVDSVSVVATAWVQIGANGLEAPAFISPKATTTISWKTSPDMKDCSASLVYPTTSLQTAWGGGVPVNGTKTITKITESQGFILKCKTVYGQNAASVVNVNVVPPVVPVPAGRSILMITSDPNTPAAQSWTVNPADGIRGVTVGTVNVKNELGDSRITTVKALVNVTGTTPSAVYLYDGNTMIDSRAGTNSSVVFENLNIIVGKDVTKTLTFKVDMPSTTVSPTTLSIGKTTSAVYVSPNGIASTAIQTSLQINNQTFTIASSTPGVQAQITLVSATANAGPTNQYGSTTAPSATFIFKVKPIGGSLVKPSLTLTSVTFGTSTVQAASRFGINSVMMIDGNPTVLNEQAEYTVTVSAVLNPTVPTLDRLPSGASNVTFYLENFKWTSTSGAPVTQVGGVQNWATNAISVIR